MGIFSDITGAISGAGSIAGAVTQVSKVIGQALGMIDRKEQRDEGAIAQRETSDEATLDTINRVNAPIPVAESDQLWDRNKTKYGPADSGPTKAE